MHNSWPGKGGLNRKSKPNVMNTIMWCPIGYDMGATAIRLWLGFSLMKLGSHYKQ